MQVCLNIYNLLLDSRHEQTAQTSKCSKFEIKAIALSVEFCAEHIKSGSGIPELENQVKKPSYA